MVAASEPFSAALAQPHLVLVEAYEGMLEHVSDDPDERQSASCLGLPIADLAEQLNCRITVLTWERWYRYAAQHLNLPTPATQPIESIPQCYASAIPINSQRVQYKPISDRDPFYAQAFEKQGLSPRSYGLINDSGFLFFVSYCLLHELQSLHQSDPIHTVILPNWGGLGYVAQMARATQAPNQLNVPFAVVVTDASAERQTANQEGFWTRQATIRRQMEDLSLALADLALVFGPRGRQRAIAGRLPEASPPILIPRRVEASLLDAIERAATQSQASASSVQCFLDEPQQAASGALIALDAVARLVNQNVRLQQPFLSVGLPMTFAPMIPRDFVDYWSSRGFVQELIQNHQWQWQRDYPSVHPASESTLAIRIYPSLFEYLPNIWSELARGSFVLISAAAAEGLALDQTLPEAVQIETPTAESVACRLETLLSLDISQLDQIRKALCQQVVEAHRSGAEPHLKSAALALTQLLSHPQPQDLSRVALLLGDRRLPLGSLAQNQPDLAALAWVSQAQTLSVIVTCYEMGDLLTDAIMSVWHSERVPDEVILVNDGSSGTKTVAAIQTLKQIAIDQNLPLQVIDQPNQGLAAARNTGLHAATSDLISFLDGDDLIEPAFYRVAAALLKQYPHLGGVAAWATIFGDSVPQGDWCAPQPELPLLLVENSVIVPCVTRTALLKALGGYEVGQRYNYEDWELSIRMVAAGWMIVTIPMHLMRYRIRQDSLYRSMTVIQNQVMREQLLALHRQTITKFALEFALQLEHQWKQNAAYLADRTWSDASCQPSHRSPVMQALVEMGLKMQAAILRKSAAMRQFWQQPQAFSAFHRLVRHRFLLGKSIFPLDSNH